MKQTLQRSSRLTLRDSSYPSCEETRVALRVYPCSQSAEEVTEFLGIEPTESHNKGDRHTNSVGRTRVAPSTGWFLSSEHQVSSRDIRDHLDWLLSRLAGTESKLRTLQGEGDTQMWITCVWWSNAGFGGPTLWPEQLLALAKLNMDFEFDFYYFGDEEDEDSGNGRCGENSCDLEPLIGRWPEALDRLKQRQGVPSAHCGTIYNNGDYMDDTGEIVGSLLDFSHADEDSRKTSSLAGDYGDGGYPGCEETHAKLRIYPGSGTATEITDMLGVAPTGQQDKESLFATSRGGSWRAPLTGWFLSSEGRVYSKDLRDHVDWLLVKLRGAKSALSALQEIEGTKVTVTCVWWSADGHGGPVLTPAQMRSFARLDLELALDVYFHGNSFGPAFGGGE